MTRALVLYHSQEYGNTAAMAEAVAEGLQSLGCEVDLFNTDHGRFDILKFPQYDCAAFGSPDPSAAMSPAGSRPLWTTTISPTCARG